MEQRLGFVGEPYRQGLPGQLARAREGDDGRRRRACSRCADGGAAAPPSPGRRSSSAARCCCAGRSSRPASRRPATRATPSSRRRSGRRRWPDGQARPVASRQRAMRCVRQLIVASPIAARLWMSRAGKSAAVRTIVNCTSCVPRVRARVDDRLEESLVLAVRVPRGEVVGRPRAARRAEDAVGVGDRQPLEVRLRRQAAKDAGAAARGDRSEEPVDRALDRRRVAALGQVRRRGGARRAVRFAAVPAAALRARARGSRPRRASSSTCRRPAEPRPRRARAARPRRAPRRQQVALARPRARRGRSAAAPRARRSRRRRSPAPAPARAPARRRRSATGSDASRSTCASTAARASRCPCTRSGS